MYVHRYYSFNLCRITRRHSHSICRWIERIWDEHKDHPTEDTGYFLSNVTALDQTDDERGEKKRVRFRIQCFLEKNGGPPEYIFGPKYLERRI